MRDPFSTAGMPASINHAIAAHLDASEQTAADPLHNLAAIYEQLDGEDHAWLGEFALYSIVLGMLPHDAEYTHLELPPGDGATRRLQDVLDNLQAKVARQDTIIRRLLDRMPDTDFDALVAEVEDQQRRRKGGEN